MRASSRASPPAASRRASGCSLCTCAHITPQALAYTNGTRASVYGKAGHHFAWHDPPSFQYISRLLLKQQHRLTTDSLVEPYSVILSHSVYWQNRDLAMFMLRFFTRRSEE